MKIYFSIMIIVLTIGFLNNIEAATVKGRVLNSRSSGPIQGATVLLIGTTQGSRTGADGSFTIENAPIGKYALTASLIGFKHKQVNIAIDSATQIVEMTILLRGEGQALVLGCIPDFVKYQSDLAGYLAKNPLALSFQISNFQVHDSAKASVTLNVTNDSPFDIYLLKDYGYGLQMYVQKLLDGSSRPVQSRKMMLYDKPAGGLLHDLSDVIRVPQHQTLVVDTVNLLQYDFAHLRTGEYKFQLVYVFPQSRATRDDSQYEFASPIANPHAVGEVYCMTLQGRYESNWLTIQIK